MMVKYELMQLKCKTDKLDITKICKHRFMPKILSTMQLINENNWTIFVGDENPY